MKGFKQFVKEMAGIGRNPKVLIPVLAVLMVPVLYSAMFLGAFWDPYAKLDDLPVAVVNSDQGTVYEGNSMHVGQDFTEKLKEGSNFEYSFVSKSQAEEGLKNNTYYMAIEIPEDFSAKTTTLTSEQPTPAQIVFMPNESFNFLAAQIGNTAIEKMKNELSREVTKAYTHTVFDQIQTLADGLSKASDGASQIAVGTDSAKNGAALIEANLNKLASGSLTMQSGITKLVDGGGKLEKGVSELQQGAGSLASGLSQLTDGSGKLKQGAVQANIGATKLADGLAQSAAGADKLEAGAKGLAGGLEQYAKAHPELADDASFQQLIAASKQVAGGLSAAKQGQDQLSAGAAQLSKGTTQLAGGLEQFGDKLNTASAGGAKLAKGADQLHGGAAQLNQGLSSLSKGFNVFVDGSSKLDQGAQQMTQGLVTLTDGTGELSSKLTDAAQKTSNIKGGDSVIDMFANPVDLNVVKTKEVPNYGTGFAPYFISLGLFVGALLLTIVYTVKEPAIKPTSGWSWFIGKLMTMVFIGTVQAIIADLVLLYGLGLEVQSMPLFILFSIITSITFMALIQFLVTVLQHPGRFIAIVILIFQLTSSAGTFPLELIPSWLQNASAWLPMTYSVAGLKAVISSGDYSFMWDNVWILLGYIALFAAMTLTYFVVAYRREFGGKHSQDHTVAV
ncbi:YhgE/Pip domain-containing protein [Cohnella silvisoli]|uniref:YhgE/Pip domain-containing protein n=1 Tax=Cohnella silvisoli TaxID=2873699 RepID=A0ABV1KQH4_9BACL|nr:YhgE/Pip domain-containing protein [Cohnella silvisoli]MCD9022218.1 YhgE/Pip domain-containing protein [Cohnella silvisoli]